MTEQLNLTDVMTEVQNFITSDGQIIPAQRDFYRVLREKMTNYTGLFTESEVELILVDSRSEVLELSDEDYTAIYDLIMDRFGLSKRLEEEARLREELVMKERLRKEAELKARAEAIAKEKAEAEARAKAEAELKAQIEEQERLVEEARKRAEEEEAMKRAEMEHQKQRLATWGY